MFDQIELLYLPSLHEMKDLPYEAWKLVFFLGLITENMTLETMDAIFSQSCK